MSSHFFCLTNENYNQWRWLPLLTPAVKEGSCDVDYDLLITRTSIIGIAILVTAVSSLALSAVLPAAIIGLPLSFLPLALLPLGGWLAERAANVKAVNEYLKMPYPSQSATFRIQTNFKAARLLIDKNGDVNKLDQAGHRLLDYTRDLNIFKLLVRSGADIKAADKIGISYFQRAVENENPAYLEYVLKNHIAKPENFSRSQQVKFWTNLGCIEAGFLLKLYGFDANVRDDKGYTPLMKIVRQDPRYLLIRNLGIESHVATLLKCGADPSITVNENGVDKNAMQINNHPQLTVLLANFKWVEETLANYKPPG